MSASLDPASEPAAVPARPARRVAGRLGGIAFVVGVVVTAIAWLLPLRTTADPGVYDVFAAISFFARVFLLPMAAGWLLLGVVAFICRRRWVGVACVLFAVGWAAPEVRMAMGSPLMRAANRPTFSIASFNLNKDLKDATWAAEVMRKMDADFVVTQEVSPHAAEQLKAALADQYPFACVYPDEYFNGMAVFSKTPLTLQHAPESYEQRHLAVVATALGREFMLVDVHLAPPQHSDKRRRNRWQTAKIIADYAADLRPVVFVGDFNFTAMTPQAFALRAAGYRDVQLETGHGRHASWPAASAHSILSILPKVRIDTAYARGPLTAVASETEVDIGSDHLPIKTTWQWAN